MPKDDLNYKFTENGIVYDFYDVFVPAENFRQPALWTWGFDQFGELGINNTGSKNIPVTTFAGGTNWKQVSSSSVGALTAAIKTDGSLWTWGIGTSAQLGNNNNTSRGTPVTTFAGGTDWKSVAAGTNSMAAIKTDGSLWTWGENGLGQLGTNNLDTRSTPVTTFIGGNDWKQVSVGYRFVGAIKTDGSLWTWGANFGTNLGINASAFSHRSTPVTTFAGGNTWKQVSCGQYHMAAIKTDGSLWIWGLNDNGNSVLGINQGNVSIGTPVTTFAGGNTWKSVACGLNHTAAIKTDGSLWVWGLGTSGQLGNFADTTRSTPVTTFAGGTNWKQVFVGNAFTTAIKTDGSLWTWGFNSNGALGNNNNTNRNTPVTTFIGGNDWKQVGGGRNHVAAIKYVPDP